jgi:hypothetical protein
VDLGSLVGGGRDNVLENNIFSSCGRAIALDARGVNGNYSDGETLFDRLTAVNHDQPPYSERYPLLAKILKDEPGQPKGNVVVRNIFVNTPSEIFSLSKSQQFVRELVKVENNLTQGDSGLVAPQQGDFRLRDNSPAARAGFVAVPVKQIGLYPDEYRRLLRN